MAFQDNHSSFDSLSLFFQWAITFFLGLIEGFIIYAYFLSFEAELWLYGILIAFCILLVCPRSPLAHRFPLWQRIALIMLIVFTL